MSGVLTIDEPLNTSTESFDALYRDSARDLYAYVRTLLGALVALVLRADRRRRRESALDSA